MIIGGIKDFFEFYLVKRAILSRKSIKRATFDLIFNIGAVIAHFSIVLPPIQQKNLYSDTLKRCYLGVYCGIK